ncbi:MAG: hypothetical protein AAGA17_09490 [Actinomycetota bacterium]
MSSIWTPGGEVPVGDDGNDRGRGPATPPPDDVPEELLGPDGEVDPDLYRQMQEQMAAAREQLLETPAAVVVANHVMGLYELGALHLTSEPPNLQEAALAIDAVALLVENLEGRLAEEATLVEALNQIRMAFVEVNNRMQSEG